MHWKKRLYCWLIAGFGSIPGTASAAAQISLSSAVGLALQNSTQVKIANADVLKATAALEEARDVYIPNFSLGSSVGFTYGFPVGQPSVFNAGSQSLVYSFSQPDYVRAARAALKAAQLVLKDNRDQVTLDCALAYVQLDTDTRELASLGEEKSSAERLVSIESDRLIAGVDSRMDKTKAEITEAQLDIDRLNIENDAADQRQKLAHFTGLPAASFVPESNSIPPVPDLASDDSLVDKALASNAGIQAANANAKSKLELFRGDENQNYRPQFGFGLEYNRYAEFNNYNQYYLRFQHNNFDVGVQITIPFFDAKTRAKARESEADARHATFEAAQAKNQTSEQVSGLRNSLKLLKAQRRLAQLNSEYAQEQLETVRAELTNGTGSPGAAPVTPKEEELALIEMQRRYQEALNANLSLIRAQLTLMRSIDAIENWANSATK